MYKNRIKEFRKKQGFTLIELSNKVGVSAGYLCHLEKGTRSNPSTKIMENIAKVLGKTIPEVFFLEEQQWKN